MPKRVLRSLGRIFVFESVLDPLGGMGGAGRSGSVGCWYVPVVLCEVAGVGSGLLPLPLVRIEELVLEHGSLVLGGVGRTIW